MSFVTAHLMLAIHKKHDLGMKLLEAFDTKMYLLAKVVTTALADILGLSRILILLAT
jgi:hypothetical protein